MGSLLLLLFAAHVLLRSPCLGVADIHDFGRVMAPAGIAHLAPLTRPGYFVVCELATGPADLLSAPSSSALLAWLAKGWPWSILADPGRMDIRQMGALFVTLLALAALSARAAGASALLVFLGLAVLVDPGYLLFFNSFYADGALFLALLATVWWLRCAGGPARSSLWSSTRAGMAWGAGTLLALSLLGGGSKMAFCLLPAIVLLALIPSLASAVATRPRAAAGMAGGLLIASALAIWTFFFGPGPRFLFANNYHAVYGGLLRVAADPDRVLAALEVPRRWWDLPRTDLWKAGVDEDHPVHRSLESLSRARLLRLYATDAAALGGARRAIEEALRSLAPHPRGNRVELPGKSRKRTYEVAWQASRLTRPLYRALSATPWLLLGIAALWIAVDAVHGRYTASTATLAFLLLWTSSQMVIAVLGEGFVNLLQHLMGARLGLDLLLAVFLHESLLALRLPRGVRLNGPDREAASRGVERGGERAAA